MEEEIFISRRYPLLVIESGINGPEQTFKLSLKSQISNTKKKIATESHAYFDFNSSINPFLCIYLIWTGGSKCS